MSYVAGQRWRFSVSQLGTLAKCAAQWEHIYVRGLRIPPGAAALIGTGTHGAIEVDLGEKMRTGSLLPDEAIPDLAADATRKAFAKEGVRLVDEELEIGEAKIQAQAVDTAVALAKLHHKRLAPIIKPLALERRFTLELPDREYDVHGVVDIEEEERIRDTKTKGKLPSQQEVDRSIQLTGYALERASRAEPVKELTLDCLLKTSNPRVEVLKTTRGPADYGQFMARTDAAWAQVKSGIFPPGQPDGWWCSHKWCGFWDDACPHGRRNAKTVALIDPKRLVSRVRVDETSVEDFDV